MKWIVSEAQHEIGLHLVVKLSQSAMLLNHFGKHNIKWLNF